MIHRDRPEYFNKEGKRFFDSNELFSRLEQRKISAETSDCYLVMMTSPFENSNEEPRFNYEEMSPKRSAIDNAFIPKSNDVKIFPQKFGDRVVLRSIKTPKKGDKSKQTMKADKATTEQTDEFMKNWQHRKVTSTSERSKTLGNVQNGNKVSMKQYLGHNTHGTTGNVSKPNPLNQLRTKESYKHVGNYYIMLPNGEFSNPFVDQSETKTSKPDDGLYINLEHILPNTDSKPKRKAPPTPLCRTFSSKDGQQISNNKQNRDLGDRKITNKYF